MKKNELLDNLRQARAELLAALDGLNDDELVQPGIAGIWSAKDLMAHLVAWEAELITALSRKLSRRYKDAPNVVNIEDIDEWNVEQYHQSAARSLSIIRQDFEGVHKHLLVAVGDLSAKVLEDALYFEWMEGEPLSYLIQDIAVLHEQEHAEDICNWKAQRDDAG